jgi:hypothetical protein
MAINLDVVILNLLAIVIGSLIISPILWLVGKAFVGPERARFIDAFWIILLGNVIGGIFNTIFTGFSASIIGFIIQLLIWIGLVKHFFDTSGWKALVIAIVAFIVTLVIFAVLAAILISVGLLAGWTWI